MNHGCLLHLSTQVGEENVEEREREKTTPTLDKDLLHAR